MNDSGLTMTNGHAKNALHTVTGEEMDIDYDKATTRHVVVVSGAQMAKMTDVGWQH